MRSLMRVAIALVAVVLVGAGNPRPLGGGAGSAPLPVQRAVESRAPAPPKVRVAVPAITAMRTVHVPAGGELQPALDRAQGGELITLEPGATYRGPFTLRRKSGAAWITIASASPELPGPGERVTPAHRHLMPRLVSSSDAVVIAEPGAHHYRLVGLEIAPEAGVFLQTLVRFGEDERSAGDLPHHLVVDRSYLHGDPRRGGRRGVALNARHAAVIGSYLTDFKEEGADSQAIAGWNGDGPFLIANNYLEAAGENVMFGGADPAIAGLVPADIEITGNYVTKPLRWKKDDPAFEGPEWAVKNLFELKNARRVRVAGNVFEHNWPHAQNGFAILFTVRNQDGGAPWSVVEDVTFENNLVRHVGGGINILGRDDNHRSQQTRRIAIRNNIFLDVGGAWGPGRLFQLLDGTAAVRIDHNTALQTGTLLTGGDKAPHTGFVFENNIARHNEYGITGSGVRAGRDALARYFPGASVRRNVIVGGAPHEYPADNFFPSSLDEIGEIDLAPRFRLLLAPGYVRAGTDGRDPGADIDAVRQAIGPLATVGLRPREAAAAAPSEAAVEAPSAAVAVFWSACLLIAYVWFGYPLIAVVRARLRPRPRRRAPIEPTVSVIVVAHNEAPRIDARLSNLLALEYPRDRLEIVVASDGSDDDTVERARRYAQAGVTVHAFSDRRGKSATLNAVVPSLRGEIIVFADARQRFEPGAVRALVENFADPEVGAASGELILTSPQAAAPAAQGTALYWQYEKLLRSTEARVDSAVGATGALYAIRRELFEPVPDDTILDDVLIPLRIVRRSYRVVFEPNARAYDAAPATVYQEFVRKARTSAGLFQLFARERWLLDPRRNRLWFETVSHKALRLALPALYAAVLGSTIALSDDWWYARLLEAQVLFYSAALVGYTEDRTERRSILFGVPCAIGLHCWVTIVGFVRFISNRQQAAWERALPSEAPAA